jgi:hypothetical protein
LAETTVAKLAPSMAAEMAGCWDDLRAEMSADEKAQQLDI